MKKLDKSTVILLLFSFVFQLGLIAQQQANDPSVTYAESITEEDFYAHLSFLADDLLEGRETGEKGQVMAAHYLRTQFMRLGLEAGNKSNGTYYQAYSLNRTNIQGGTLNLGKKSFEYGKDFLSIGSPGMPNDLNADWVFAGYGISSEDYDNLANLELTGKIALVLGSSREPKEGESLGKRFAEWGVRKNNLAAAGASTMVMILPDKDIEVLSRIVRRSGLSPVTEEKGTYTLYVSETLGNEILKGVKSSLEKQKDRLSTKANPDKLNFSKLKFTYDVSVDRQEVVPTNVLGFLEGTDKKDEVLIITAHYDHVGILSNGEVNNGADDDASGTTAVLELAEAFSLAAENGHRPRRSILFMAVSGEEKGLLGSAYYVDHPIYPIESTIANLNIDMIGRVGKEYIDDPDALNYIYVIGSDRLSTELHEIGEKANDTYTNLKLDYKYNDRADPNRFYYRSDHYNFAKHGIPIIFYFNGTHEDYHKPTDDIEKIELGKAVKISKLIFHTAWELANREERIVVDKPVE